MQQTVSRTEHEDIGTLIARMIQAMSTLVRQIVALCWGLSPSVTWEIFPGMPGFQVPAGTSLFRKFPVAVEPAVEMELASLVVGAVERALLDKVALFTVVCWVRDVPLAFPIVGDEMLTSKLVCTEWPAIVAVPGLANKGTFVPGLKVTHELFLLRISPI